MGEKKKPLIIKGAGPRNTNCYIFNCRKWATHALEILSRKGEVLAYISLCSDHSYNNLISKTGEDFDFVYYHDFLKFPIPRKEKGDLK